MRYPIIIHKDPKSDYGVIVPDLPGCFTGGTTLEETMDNAKEAVECHIEGLLKDGDSVPKPSAIEAIRKRCKTKNGVWAIVEVNIGKLSVKAKRVNILLPERLLNAIDKFARAKGESRSGLLAKAAMEFIASH